MILQVLLFIAVLAVLVLSHEFGHFIVARLAKIKVEEFGFGFPPRLLKWQGKKTMYSLNLLPLGGFVKLKGEDRGDRNDPQSFVAKKPWVRAAVLLAGVGMNLVLAAVLLSAGFLFGVPTAIDGPAPSHATVRDQHLEILNVVKNSPAATAGIVEGDFIQKLNGHDVTGRELVADISAYFNEEKPLHLTILRGGTLHDVLVTPELLPDTHKPGIGVSMIDVATVSYLWYLAVWEGVKATAALTVAVVVGMAQLIGRLVTGGGVSGDVTGPVGIAVLTSKVAALGIPYFVQFVAMLSVNLAVLNILPFPALDGGRLLFVIIEKIRRKPVTPRIEQLTHVIGFAVLLLLVAVVSVRDIMHLIK